MCKWQGSHHRDGQYMALGRVRPGVACRAGVLQPSGSSILLELQGGKRGSKTSVKYGGVVGNPGPSSSLAHLATLLRLGKNPGVLARSPLF